SGKKLLQALDLPSFMRPSVVLCSIQLSSQVAEFPLLLITPERILALQSQFAPSIQQLIEDNNLLSEVRNL
ncbi:MAG TPA: tRNA(Ile)-lysidine synthetase, partial [Psychrobacter sp.]|nr:tRNA(Ile)-lysidine synthetase [Psychrobacter sp.]